MKALTVRQPWAQLLVTQHPCRDHGVGYEGPHGIGCGCSVAAKARAVDAPEQEDDRG